jgi:hypothetical protein
MSRTGAGAKRAFRAPNRNQDVKGKCQMNNQMNRKKACVTFIVLLTCALASQALAQGQEIELKSNSDDLTKISSVVEEFRQDIIHKNGYAITKLILNPDVLFHHINNQEEVDGARKQNAQFDGVGPSQLDGFVKLLATSKDKLEEKFRNIEIRQDGDLGLVTFNYDFVINDKVHHSGVEHWQVCKIDGQWKILSVTWTQLTANSAPENKASLCLVIAPDR